jgi:hypothetical protein
VNWFRKHLKHGSRLALLALVIQFALSFGHFHADAAGAAPAVQAGLADAGLAAAAPAVLHGAADQGAQQPPGHDTDRHASDCAICAFLSVANNFLFANPPQLALQEAVELLHLISGAEFAHLGSLHPAFHSRAPPIS